MMGILSNAPQGFSSAVTALNLLPQGLLAEMCQDVIAFLQYKVGFIPDYDNISSTMKLDPKPSVNMQTCVNALTYIFRSAAEAELSADALVSELRSSMEWKESTIAVLKHVWKEEGQALCSLPKETLSVGQTLSFNTSSIEVDYHKFVIAIALDELVSMDWKLGVAMSSSSCRSLNSPYISLQLTVAETAGRTKTHTLEMTIPEFQKFSTQLKEMASTLETAA